MKYLKSHVSKIIVGLAVMAISVASTAVVKVNVMEEKFRGNDVEHIRIEHKLNRVLCLMGEVSNCKE